MRRLVFHSARENFDRAKKISPPRVAKQLRAADFAGTYAVDVVTAGETAFRVQCRLLRGVASVSGRP